MQAELAALTRALDRPERPLVAIVGGAKVSTKLELLGNLVKRVDALVIGGGMANTFLAAQGKAVGKSLCEHDLLGTARKILADSGTCEIVLPVDAVVASDFKAHAASRVVDVDAIGPDDMMLDIGPQSVARVKAVLEGAKTLVWNGPFGAFEMQPFDAGTMAVAQGGRRAHARRQARERGGRGRHRGGTQSGGRSRRTDLCVDGGRRLSRMDGGESAPRRRSLEAVRPTVTLGRAFGAVDGEQSPAEVYENGRYSLRAQSSNQRIETRGSSYLPPSAAKSTLHDRADQR